jgi:hypothetical protein
MAKFSIDWFEKVYYNAVIEADSKEEAIRIFYVNEPFMVEETDRDFEYVTHIEEIE